MKTIMIFTNSEAPLIINDILFKKDVPLYIQDLNKILARIQVAHEFDKPYVITFEEEVHYIIPNIQDIKNTKPHVFMKVIREMAEEICQCPSLEFVVSPFYVKCYLDKPGLYLEDVQKYDDILKDNGTLELHTQRPYMLYVYYGVHDDIGEGTRNEVD